MAEARERWSFDPVVLNLEGYHHKNAYMVRYSAAINAGRPPQDELLRRAENRFLETLTIDPTDPSALNGLGSILMLELELDAAEFFILAAIAAARKRGLPAYEAAESDLEVVRYYRSVSPTSSQRHP
ncbi:MAG TPA: hypothetical protein VI300_00775 [Solirubrobacter sp.]